MNFSVLSAVQESCSLTMFFLSMSFRHCEEYNVIGLDCEFISQYYRHPVALLQLASHRGLCALIRLCNLKKIPHELQVCHIIQIYFNLRDTPSLTNDFEIFHW